MERQFRASNSVLSHEAMNKSELIREAARRSGLTRGRAARAVEATLDIVKRELGAEHLVQIRGLGRLHLRQKRQGFSPAFDGGPPVPIPAGKAVRLIPTRSAVVSLNTEPLKLDITENNPGGNMKHEKESNGGEAAAGEGSALGLDIGTSRMVLASGAAERIKAKSELNAFITVPYSKFTESILKQNKVNYQLNGGKTLQVFGNEATRFANVFNTEVRRPMMGGTLNPTEEYSMSVMGAIISQLVRKTKSNETLRFSVPGPLRNGGSPDLVYHEAMLRDLLSSMGYNAKGINERLAVVFSELERENFSGIGISCGGGMCNVALAFMSIPVMTFSNDKAGDYIDRNVGAVTGEIPTRIRAIKEEGLDLASAPKNKYESALHVYYDDVILSLVEALRSALAEAKNMPKIDHPIPIVLSGGTAKPKGFLEKFQQTFKRDGFPLEISEIRLAADPLTATARGCLMA
ncbi:MAG TPA: HU family DNA-binding protein, partial [Blastocatellia bacterium]|nr:HU family DNA-binding protein [Blastocatellia bacterium]